jgi:hypothetical protein
MRIYGNVFGMGKEFRVFRWLHCCVSCVKRIHRPTGHLSTDVTVHLIAGVCGMRYFMADIFIIHSFKQTFSNPADLIQFWKLCYAQINKEHISINLVYGIVILFCTVIKNFPIKLIFVLINGRKISELQNRIHLSEDTHNTPVHITLRNNGHWPLQGRAHMSNAEIHNPW